MIHELKILPEYFQAVITGKKLFEVRKNDRPFKEGDLLALNEYNSLEHIYTGNSCLVYVDYILSDTEYCKGEYVVMSIKPCFVSRSQSPKNHIKFCEDYSVPLATYRG